MHAVPEDGSSDNRFWAGQSRQCSDTQFDGRRRFAILTSDGIEVCDLSRINSYQAATDFIAGKINIEGDLYAAIRFFSQRGSSGFQRSLLGAALNLRRLAHRLPIGARRTTARNIQFHYDRSNEFYSLFLDRRLQYSAAHFSHPEQSLDEAQTKKLGRICDALELHQGERFLDVGCGWGGLVTYAAQTCKVDATGCTLSIEQRRFAADAAKAAGISDRVAVHLKDYRDLSGTFDKIASIGMFEHVGPMRLARYLKKIHSLLATGGRFLNRGIVRPASVGDGVETYFLEKYVFPGGELVHLDDVVREGERAGFEVLSVENVRRHYGLTCRAWVKNLQEQADICKRLVGEFTYRIWLLYLAASAVNFEDAGTSAMQVLFAKL